MNIMYHHVWIFQYTLVESTVGFLFAAGHGSSWTVVNAQMDHDGPLGINMGWPEDIVIGYLKIEYSSCSLYKIVVFGGPHCIDTAMIHSCPASVCCRGVPLHMHWHVIEPVFLAAIAFFPLNTSMVEAFKPKVHAGCESQVLIQKAKSQQSETHLVFCGRLMSPTINIPWLRDVTIHSDDLG